MRHSLIVKPVAVICLACLICSCASSTPRARIGKAPQRYDSLAPEHREMIRDGIITRGMPMDAVYFAWGKPAVVTSETRKNKETIRWDYAHHKPVFHDPDAYTSYGRAFANPSYRDQLITSARPTRDPTPYRTATVWFVDGTVEEWENLR